MRLWVCKTADNMSKVKGKNFKPSKHLFYSFLKRTPRVKIVHRKKREKVRSFITPEIVTLYFTELKHVLDGYNLNQPGNVWNVDESGISLDHPLLKFCKDVEINRTESYIEGQAQQHW